jgi:hypothetical protein
VLKEMEMSAAGGSGAKDAAQDAAAGPKRPMHFLKIGYDGKETLIMNWI